jgi:hypothetical protein
MTYKVSGTSMILVALCFMLGAAPSFAGPPNNDVSDAGRNTAGGSGALFNNSTGVDNTAFGFLGLASNTVAATPPLESLCLDLTPAATIPRSD